MNESELREGLRSALATSEPRPPMSADAALEAGRAAHRRRRTTVAAAGSMMAVVAIAIGGTQLLPGGTSQGGSGGQPVSVTPAPTDTEQVWPTGADGSPQQDRTATNGARFEQGVRLLAELVGVVPAGYTVPQETPILATPQATAADLSPQDDPWARLNQSQFSERVGEVEVWEHVASLAVSGNGGTGRLYVQVHTPGNTLPAGTCDLATQLWGLGGDCQVTSSGGKEVGMVANTSDRKEFERWAAYRHADGTVVYVAQARAYRDGVDTPLPQPLFTDEQLAALATDERFHQVVIE